MSPHSAHPPAPRHAVAVRAECFRRSLGWWDTQIHNDASFMTENFGSLAQQGITLMRHHTYLYCSPTR